MWRFAGTGLALTILAWGLLLWTDRVYDDPFGGWFVPVPLLALPAALVAIATGAVAVIRGRTLVSRAAALLAAVLSAYATFVVLVTLLLAVLSRTVAIPVP